MSDIISFQPASPNTERLVSMTIPSQESQEQRKPASTEPTLRLEFLDGLRGLAALYVVAHHAYMQSLTFNDKWMPEAPLAPQFTRWIMFGHQAVAVFIILSGFCLMLPVARSKDGTLRGGFRAYIWRRARRILPPYYAILALSLFLIYTVDGLGRFAHVHWDFSLPAFRIDVILTHIFLVHNLAPSWIFRIGHPFWSVATEWQIYFAFPFLLLPVWRRLGILASVAVGFAVGLAPAILLTNYFKDPSFWFLGLFALGMAGAAICFSDRPGARRVREMKLPWSLLGWLCFGAFCWVASTQQPISWNWTPYIWQDVLIGGATFCLIVNCARALQQGRLTWTTRFLQSRPIAFLGSFSYSLYLTHAIVIATVHVQLRALNMSPITTMNWMFAICIPVSLIVAYLFFLAFERPFLSSRSHAVQKTPQPVSATS
jgi:peptidoglycan/LPS O-acetylase OafA/YrhL